MKIIKGYIFRLMIGATLVVIALTVLGESIKIFSILAGLAIGTMLSIPLKIVLNRIFKRIERRLEKEHNEAMIDLYSNITSSNGK